MGSRCGGDDAKSVGLLDDGDGLRIGRRDVPALAQKADLPRFLDRARMVDGKMQVEELRVGRRTPAGRGVRDAVLDGLVGGHAGAAGDVVGVVPGDLGGEQFVGLLAGGHSLDTEEGGQAFLPKAELTLDLALGLGVPGDEVADTEATEGALELGEGVGISGLARFVAEEAQSVGVEVVGQAVGKEDFPDVGEVGEGGFRLDEASSDDVACGVVDGHGEDLEALGGPPLVRGAVVLEKVAITLALPSAAGFWPAPQRFAQQVGEMLADVGPDVGGRTAESEAPREFVGKECEIGFGSGGQRVAQEGDGLGRPWGSAVPAGGLENEAAAVGQPARSQLVEPGAADAEAGAGVRRAQRAVVERLKSLIDDCAGQTVKELLLSIPGSPSKQGGPASRIGALPRTPEFTESWANGSGGDVLPPERGSPFGSLSHPCGYSGCSPAEPYPPHGSGQREWLERRAPAEINPRARIPVLLDLIPSGFAQLPTAQGELPVAARFYRTTDTGRGRDSARKQVVDRQRVEGNDQMKYVG